jgi:DNA-binding IclR family transcriptional regulator
MRLDSDDWRSLPNEERERALREIQEAVLLGYAVDRGTYVGGIGAVAAVVEDQIGEPTGALSVILPSERLTETVISEIGESLLGCTRVLAGRGDAVLS